MLRLWQKILTLGVERAVRNARQSVVQSEESLRLAEELARRLEAQQRPAA